MTDGAFNETGSFVPKKLRNPQGIDGFIAELVKLRRSDYRIPPWEFAKRIQSSPYKSAFPNAVSTSSDNRCRWTGTILVEGKTECLPWYHAGASTGAEACVKYATSRHLVSVLSADATTISLDQLVHGLNFKNEAAFREDAHRARVLAQVREFKETECPVTPPTSPGAPQGSALSAEAPPTAVASCADPATTESPNAPDSAGTASSPEASVDAVDP